MAKKKPALQLKPGNHAFVPGGPAEHNNQNTTPEQLAWYTAHYPHLLQLCQELPPEQESADSE